MLKNYPTLLFVLHRCGWYFLTFLVAITINFFLPRFGADPIDLIMSKQKGLSAKQARLKQASYMKEFGLVELSEVTTTVDGALLVNADATPVSFKDLKSKDLLELNELQTLWMSDVKVKDSQAFATSLKTVLAGKTEVLKDLGDDFNEDDILAALKDQLTLAELKSLKGVSFKTTESVYNLDPAKMNAALNNEVTVVSSFSPYLVDKDGKLAFYIEGSEEGTTIHKIGTAAAITAKTITVIAKDEVINEIGTQKDGTKVFNPMKRPLIKQYISYMVMVLQGDLGTSFIQYPKKVNTIVAEAIPWTLALQFPTIVLGWIAGNMLGALAAYKRGMFDKVLFPAALLTNSIPFFAVGMLLVYVFAELIPIFPSAGGYAIDVVPGFSWAFISSAAFYYVLPFFSIMPVFAAGQATGMRTMGIYELGTGYVKYAKTLGIKENKILMYIFRNAMLPQLTGLALMLGVMIGGALITEMIFSYPGLGMALLSAAQNNDYPLIQGAALIVTVTVLLSNFTVDILIGFFDPRVKAGRTGA